MPPSLIPDLVRLSELRAEFLSDTALNLKYTQHVELVAANAAERRKVRKVEQWVKQKKLGEGGFGLVYVQKCIVGEKKDQLRAVKRIKKQDSINYNRELEAIALFSQLKYEQCFVRSYGWYGNDDYIFIAMEYLPNGDLSNCIKEPLPENESKVIVFQLLEGLSYMHEHGFAHRDLKPANVLVVHKPPRRWWVKLADFGISKRAADGQSELRTAAGTPAFAAPEVFGVIQSDSYTSAVDIWSLGNIAYRLITGETIFRDPARLYNYVRGTFKFPIGALEAKQTTAAGCQLLKKMVSPKPEDRPTAPKCLQDEWLLGVMESNSPADERPNVISMASEETIAPSISAETDVDYTETVYAQWTAVAPNSQPTGPPDSQPTAASVSQPKSESTRKPLRWGSKDYYNSTIPIRKPVSATTLGAAPELPPRKQSSTAAKSPALPHHSRNRSENDAPPSNDRSSHDSTSSPRKGSMIQRGALGVAEALIGGAVLVHQARKKSEDREKDRTTSQNSNSGGKNLLKAAAQGFLDGDAGYDSSEAESELSDSSKEQALRLARAHGNKDIIGILMGEKIDPDAPAPFFGNILQEAVSYGNTAIVRTLLNKGSNVNLQGGHFSSALQCAAAGENSEIFRILIKKGADIHVEGGNYGSVLQAAAYRSSLENVSLLVSSGANVNAQGGQFGTPLAAAASMGALDVVKLLLQSRADPNLRGGHYDTAIQAGAASFRASEDVVSILLKHGADPSLQGGHHGSALEASRYSGNLAVERLLIENGALKTFNENASSSSDLPQNMATEPVLIAAQKGDLKRVNRYLRKGVDINKIFTGHGTILQVAAASGNLALVQFLLLQDKKPDPQLGGGRYDNAIDAARQNGHTEIANLLSRALEEISSGSEVNTEDESSDGSTFPSPALTKRLNEKYGMGTNHLVLAALRGDIDDVRQIIKHDKLVRLDDHFLEHGNALQAASKGGYLEIVKLLIAKGSDVNWNGGHYGNPLSAAAYHKHVDVVRYLCENGAEVNTTHSGFCYSPLNAAIEGGSKEIVELLIKNHADVNLGRGGGPSYITALDVALFRGDDEITQLLYDAGASMTRREYEELPELDTNDIDGFVTAAERGDKYTVTRYVEKGIDINGLSTKRRYALPAAARKGRIFVVAYLLHMGCNVNIHSGSDGTALIASAENGHKDVVELMLTYGADAHVETPKYGSAAVAAQRKGHTEIVTIINHYIQTQNAQRNLFDAKMTAAAEITERGRRQLQENMRQSLDGQSKQKSQLEDGIARELKKAEEYRVVGSDAKMQPQFSNAWEKPQLASPVYAPPTLPAGWIAQWDKNTSLYYYVELSTGVSQWQVPTQFSTPGAGDNSLASRFDDPLGTRDAASETPISQHGPFGSWSGPRVNSPYTNYGRGTDMVDRKDKTPSKKGLQLYVELYHKNMEAQRSFAAGSEEAPFFPHLNEVYYEKLISLATTGETAALQNFLPNGIFPELISSIGFRNAIIAATEYGNFDTLLVLLSQCTDYSTESGVLIYGSDTPMVIQEAYTIARKADRMELMQFLELFGAKKDYISQADLQLFNENLRTYAFNGDTESLKKLIPLENATHEIVSSEAYKEALCFAADNGHYDAASYLLELERYIVRVDGDYLHIYQAYELALEKQHTRLVGLFGRFAESKGYSLVLPVRNRKSTPTTATEVPAAFREDRAKYQQKLLGLAKTGSAEALQTFLPVSVSPEFFSSTAYRSAIIAATEHGNFDALQVLLARAFDYSKGFDAVVHNSGSSVMQAAYEIAQMADRMDMMQLLELFGAKKDDRSDSERFCEMLLHYASDGDTESLKKLLPLTSFTNEFADSPAYKEALYAAAKNGRYTPVQYFLEGEQRVVRDDGNYSHVQKAYDIAQNMGHSELKPLFRNFAAKMGFTLAIYGGAELPDGNIPEPDIVHYAARGDTMNIKRLLPRLIPQLRTSLSREPLYHRQFRDAVHAATANGHYDTVKYLLGCISSEPADAEPAATAAAAASSLFEEGYNIAQNIQNPRLMGLYKLVALDKHDIELPSIKHLRN